MSNGAILSELVRQAQALVQKPDHEFRHFEKLIRRLTPADIAALLTFATKRAAMVVDAEGLTDQFIYLHRDGEINFQIKVIGSEVPTDELCANEFDLILMNISSVEVTVPVFQTKIDPKDLTLRPPALVRGAPLLLAPHCPTIIPAYEDILDLRSVTRPTPCLLLHSAARGPVTWVFDRKTGHPKHLTSTNLQASRMQLAARLLGATGSKQDAATLVALASSDEAGFIRWEAAEALYRLDPARGAALIRDRLATDKDRTIRKAAAATLAQLQ
jgi:hypothetical protein